MFEATIARREKVFYILFFSVYVIHHLLTLSFSPIPWIDEVAFADLTHSFSRNHTFYENAFGFGGHEPVLIYGPVYFMIQTAVTKVFGFTLFTFRMTNLFFGLADLALIYRLCMRLNLKAGVAMLIVFIISLDPQFNQFLNSGRMDFVALFFYLAAFLLLLAQRSRERQNIACLILAGILLSLAALTNPRILFAYPAFAAYFVYDLYLSKRLTRQIVLRYGVICASMLAVYYLWVLMEFGSFGRYLSETFNNQNIKNHVGFNAGNFYFRYNVLFFIGAFACIALLIFRKKVKENAELLLATAPVIMGFLLIVTHGISGRYYGTIVPFVILLIAGSSYALFSTRAFKAIALLMVAPFITALIAKAAYVYGTLDAHDHAAYEREIFRHVPDSVRVAGDFAYYYMATDHHCDYEVIEQEGYVYDRITYFENKKYDYLIINKNNQYKALYDSTLIQKEYLPVANVIRNNGHSLFHDLFFKMGMRISEDYDCTIYKLK